MKKITVKRHHAIAAFSALALLGSPSGWAQDADFSSLSLESAKKVFESFELKALDDGSVAITGFAYKDCLKHFKLSQTKRQKDYVFEILATAELEPCMTSQKAQHAKKSPAERAAVRQRLSALPNAVIEKRDAAMAVGFLNEQVDPPAFVQVLSATATRDCVDCNASEAPGAPDVGAVAETEELSAAMKLAELEKEIAAADITKHRNLARLDRRIQDWARENGKTAQTRELRLALVSKLQLGSPFSVDAHSSAIEILSGKGGLGLRSTDPQLLEAYRKLVGAGLFERVRKEGLKSSDATVLRQRCSDIISFDLRFEQDSKLKVAIASLRSAAHIDQKGYNRTEIVESVVAALQKDAATPAEPVSEGRALR